MLYKEFLNKENLMIEVPLVFLILGGVLFGFLMGLCAFMIAINFYGEY